MSEMALTASRKARLQVMVEAGDGGAQAAMDLHDNPTKFLSVVQIGITSIGILNGIVGDAAFSAPFAAWLPRDLPGQRARRRDQCDRADRRGDHLPDDHLRRAGAQAHRPDPPGDGRAPGRAADGVAVDRRAPVRAPAVGVHRRHPAAAGRARRGRTRGDRGGDRGEPGGGPRRRRDRGPGAPDGAQRVPPRRPQRRLDDDSARRTRLARRRGRCRRRAACDPRERAQPLPGVPWRPGRRASAWSRRRRCCSRSCRAIRST